MSSTSKRPAINQWKQNKSDSDCKGNEEWKVVRHQRKANLFHTILGYLWPLGSKDRESKAFLSGRILQHTFPPSKLCSISQLNAEMCSSTQIQFQQAVIQTTRTGKCHCPLIQNPFFACMACWNEEHLRDLAKTSCLICSYSYIVLLQSNYETRWSREGNKTKYSMLPKAH